MTEPEITSNSSLYDISLSRRRLLALGAAGMLAAVPLTAGAQSSNSIGALQAFRTLGVGGRPLAIGYLGTLSASGSTKGGPLGNTGLNVAEYHELRRAEALRQGDLRLADSGAKVRVLGLYPQDDPAVLAPISSLALDVYYAPFHEASFNAWSFVNGSVPRSSSPFSFSVPLDVASGMQLGLSYLAAGASAPLDMRLHFSLGNERGVPKLQSGTYIFALPNAAATLPDWRRHRLLTANPENASGPSLVRLDSARRPRAAGYPYLLLSVS